jgi:hypothetical protein
LQSESPQVSSTVTTMDFVPERKQRSCTRPR